MVEINCKTKLLPPFLYPVSTWKRYASASTACGMFNNTWFSWNAILRMWWGMQTEKQNRFFFTCVQPQQQKENGKSIAKHYFAYRIIHMCMRLCMYICKWTRAIQQISQQFAFAHITLIICIIFWQIKWKQNENPEQNEKENHTYFLLLLTNDKNRFICYLKMYEMNNQS